jgi:uncharacterized protein
MKTIIRNRIFLAAVIAIALLLGGSAAVGGMMGGGILHPYRKPLTSDEIAMADRAFAQVHATRTDFEAIATDGAKLRGWKVRAENPNGSWVVLIHGVGDNRASQTGYAQFMLAHGYSVVMMDARAQGESEGAMATYGWLERDDARVVDATLSAAESVQHLFYFGESMGAAIALQSAAVDQRIAGVVAEDPFSSLREVTYDYAGLQFSPLLGKTLFRPAAMVALSQAEKEGGFKVDEVSPEKAVAARAFPMLLICGTEDHNIPCRHAQRIFDYATGPKEIWIVKGAGHTMAYGVAHDEFERRVLGFFESSAKNDSGKSTEVKESNRPQGPS